MPAHTLKTIFIVDDDIALCQSLQWLLESVGLSTKIFNSGLDFLDSFQSMAMPGCILLDIRMPEMGGLELQEQLNKRKNSSPIIFMTGHGDIPMAVRAMKMGAFDFITKPFNDQTLLEQIQKALTHYQKHSSANQESSSIQQHFNSLTQRETEVLKWVAAGKLNKEIAYELKISIKTIELHRSNIMRKMHASTSAELVKFYLIACKTEQI